MKAITIGSIRDGSGIGVIGELATGGAGNGGVVVNSGG